MTTPTQAQIEAAAGAFQKRFLKYDPIAFPGEYKAAIAAAIRKLKDTP